MKGESKMTTEPVKILEAAKKYDRRAMIWFELFEESNDDLDWVQCKELTLKMNTMLEAYEILTGKKVYRFKIDEELALMLN